MKGSEEAEKPCDREWVTAPTLETANGCEQLSYCKVNSNKVRNKQAGIHNSSVEHDKGGQARDHHTIIQTFAFVDSKKPAGVCANTVHSNCSLTWWVC